MPKAELKISASELYKGLDDMADGVFVVDGKLRIHMWNKAAEEILGFRKEDVQGQLCYQILRGSNGEGNPICSKHCKVLKLAKESKPISSYDTQVRISQGEKCWLNMSILALRFGHNGENMMITHIFRDVSQKKDDEIILNQILEKARRYQKNAGNITRRQHEVLTLLARGYSTHEIADSLFISQYTVRNHIQLIFQKFQVNNRLEAVAFALKNGLLDYVNGEDVL
jgi:PAS domain S-box-containing protein